MRCFVSSTPFECKGTKEAVKFLLYISNLIHFSHFPVQLVQSVFTAICSVWASSPLFSLWKKAKTLHMHFSKYTWFSAYHLICRWAEWRCTRITLTSTHFLITMATFTSSEANRASGPLGTELKVIDAGSGRVSAQIHNLSSFTGWDVDRLFSLDSIMGVWESGSLGS